MLRTRVAELTEVVNRQRGELYEALAGQRDDRDRADGLKAALARVQVRRCLERLTAQPLAMPLFAPAWLPRLTHRSFFFFFCVSG